MIPTHAATRVIALVATAAATALGVSGVDATSPAQRATPEIFARGAISTSDNELNAAFTPDGRTLYFTRKAGDGRFAVILESHLLPNGTWAAPEVASFSGRYADYDPFIAPDGSRLFFISNRPVSGVEAKRDYDIWVVERAANGWGAPKNLGVPVNSAGDELYPSTTSEGTLYFSSCGRPDSRGRCDLYRARLRQGRYLDPESLGDSVNTPASETDVFVAPDESYIVYAVYGRNDAEGDGDLYGNFRRGDTWSATLHLGGGINTVAREYCPIVSPDGKYLYFTSQRGFPDAPQRRALTYRELRDSLASVRNGLGDVYRVPMSVLRDSR